MAKKGGRSGGGPDDDAGRLEKQPTGILDLDEILLGGVPVGSSVLISGASGTGKTTTCFEILGRAAHEGEQGIIYLTSETPERAMANMEPFEFFSSSIIDEGKLQVKDMNDLFSDLGIEHPDTGLSQEDGNKLLEALGQAVEDTGAKRLAIDSLSGVLAAFEEEGRIRTFLKALVRTFSSKGVTIYLTSELQPGSVRYSSLGIEDTLVDGVILLTHIESRGDLLRGLQIVKIRGTPHSRSRYVMDLTEYGMIIVPVLKSYAKGGGEG